MKPVVVANSTPLIGLSRIRRLHILEELFGKVIVPAAVFREVSVVRGELPGAQEVRGAEWIETREVHSRTVVEFLALTVDAGEAEAIALAKEIGADLLLIDDRRGRRTANGVGLSISGTPGVLLRYYQGDEKGFQVALGELVANGFRLGRDEQAKILGLASRHAPGSSNRS